MAVWVRCRLGSTLSNVVSSVRNRHFLLSQSAATFSSSKDGSFEGPSHPSKHEKEEFVVSVDRSGLASPSGFSIANGMFGLEPYSERRILAIKLPRVTAPGRGNGRPWKVEPSEIHKHISSLIQFRGGPISVAEYMGEVLTNPTSGFYMHRDVFGSKGHFVTSPDTSQMFGEMLGVWCMLLWEQMGQPKNIALVELGPGRGTLLADLIRGTSKFQKFARALSLHLVECSPMLRGVQAAALHLASKAGVPISWHLELQEVPRGVPCIIIAHEFYDALPIHQFQKTNRGWCEKLVDVDDSGQEFRFVLSPKPTTASTLYLEKRLLWAGKEEKSLLEHAEVCPQAWKLTEDIADRVASDGGGALIIDYGEDEIISDSLQAIRDHRFVRVLEDPGSADLSAYVDFAAIKRTVENLRGGAAAYGPVTQSKLLGALGINFRFESLLNACESDSQSEALQWGYWVLVGDGPAPWLEDSEDESQKPLGIGSRYKTLAIVHKDLSVPVGFYK